MLDLVKYLVSNLVDKPEAVQVEEVVDPSGIHFITISVAPEDMGQVIGKNGKIINSLRELVKVKAIKQGIRVRINLKDPRQTNPPFPSELPAAPAETE